MTSEVFNTDCLEYMRTLPDNYFQLAIADPPYGIGEDGAKNHSRGKCAPPTMYTPKDWDKSAPEKDFFAELTRVSKYRIIWGANHFIENLPTQKRIVLGGLGQRERRERLCRLRVGLD